MSEISTRILPRLTSFWSGVPTDTKTDVDQPLVTDTVTKGGITILPVEVVPRFYRYVKGTATSETGKTYEYTNRFISDPDSDDPTQQTESVACKSAVEAELARWRASDQAK